MNTDERLEEFKAKLSDLMTELEAGEIEKVWRTREQWAGHDLPEWVAGVVWIENSSLCDYFGGHRHEWHKVVDRVESLMQECGLWYELENSCVMWLYDEQVMNALMDQKERMVEQ